MKNSVRANCSHLSPQNNYGVLCTVKNARPCNRKCKQKVHGIYIMTASRIEFSIYKFCPFIYLNYGTIVIIIVLRLIHNLQNCNFFKRICISSSSINY